MESGEVGGTTICTSFGKTNQSLMNALLMCEGQFLCRSRPSWDAMVQDLGCPLGRKCTVHELTPVWNLGHHLDDPGEVYS